MRPIHHSHNFCSPIFLAETFGRRALQWQHDQVSEMWSKRTLHDMKNAWKTVQTCLGRQCWWCWFPGAPLAGQYRRQGATVGRETGSIPRTTRCIWEGVLPRSPLVLAVWDGSDRGWRGESRAAVGGGAERVCNSATLKIKCCKKLTAGSSSLVQDVCTPTVGLLRTELTVDAGPKPVRDLMYVCWGSRRRHWE